LLDYRWCAEWWNRIENKSGFLFRNKI
jgi:hypothetical protein